MDNNKLTDKEFMLCDNMIPRKFYMMDMNFMRDVVYGFGYETGLINNTMKTNKNSHYGLYGGFKESEHKFEDKDGKIYTFRVGVADDTAPSGNRKRIVVLSETEQECVLVFIDEDVGDAILQNVSYYRDCAQEGLRRPGGGTILLRFIYKYLVAAKNKYNIKRIVLRDNSHIYCEKCSRQINLADLKMTTDGRTWYSKYGFKPYDPIGKKPKKALLKGFELNKKILMKLKTNSLNIVKIAEKVKRKEKVNYSIDEIKRLMSKYEFMTPFIKRLADEFPKYCCLLHYILERLYDPKYGFRLTSYYEKIFYLDLKDNDMASMANMAGGENHTVSMDKMERMINKKFQSLLKGFSDPRSHKFFDSHEWFKSFLKENMSSDAKYTQQYIKENDPDGKHYGYNGTTSIKDIKPVNLCKYKPKKIISPKQLDEFYEIVSDEEIDDFNKIREVTDKMFDYNHPSTIDNLETYLQMVKNDANNAINIIVVGAGPIGLYTALYLDKYYNRNYIKQKANILLLDNRISEEGVKLPYSRVTQFGFQIDQFQPFIPRIFCWKNRSIMVPGRHFDFIYVLENLLYLRAFHDKIPMYFTKKYETFDELKDMAAKYNFNFILDCSGGRLGINLEGDVGWNNLEFKKGNNEIRYVGNNMYRLFVEGQEYEQYTATLTLYDKDSKPFKTMNIFSFVSSEDLLLVKKYEDKCYRKADYVKISRHFKNDNLRYYYPKLLEELGIDDNMVEYVKLTTFNSNPHHVNRVAKMLDKNLIYIGLGDTLGSSEYGIHFGMKDGVAFSQYVCHLVGMSK